MIPGQMDSSIYLLFRSLLCHKAAALFELKLTRYELDLIVPQNLELQLISTFYDQNDRKPIGYVACAPLGSGTFLLLPNEFDEVNNFRLNKNIDYTREFPCIFNSATNVTISLSDNAPLGRKVHPFAVTVNNKVYVLARRHILQPLTPEPSFEAYDTINKKWATLAAPPFNKDIGPDFPNDCTRGFHTSGYAVFGNFLIVCLRNRNLNLPRHAIFSYNTLNNEWKSVYYSVPQVYDNDEVFRNYDGEDSEDEEDGEFRIWSGEAVVINNYIYAYIFDLGGLVSYSCTNTLKDGFDLSLGKIIYLESDEYPDWTHMTNGSYEQSGAVGRIGVDLICMVKTILCWSKDGTPRQPVLAAIYRILEGGRCSKLKTFDLYIRGTEHFDFGVISSCFMLNPEVVSSLELGERNPKKPAVSNKGVDAALALEVQLTSRS